MTNYIVKIFDSASGWLHTELHHESDKTHPDEISKEVVERVKNESGQDLGAGYRVAVFDAETGEGVPVPEDKPEPVREPMRDEPTGQNVPPVTTAANPVPPKQENTSA